MAGKHIMLGRCFAATLAMLAAPAARAASLQQVDDWGRSGLPPDVNMYIYVPDKVADKPPILALIHYCGGTAPAVFGQARGGGIVSAADQYGFVIVVPSSGRCWDVRSDATRTRNGGGDSQAIAQMVQHTVDAYDANAERIYATGDSSGGMMTELLLALYPDVFKAGSAFAGMPAGCRAANESGDGGGYSGACAGGSVLHTPQEWGDIARAMDTGYVGRRPRVQLFHGDADTTIRYPNHTEAIKQWTDVLGLSATPTSAVAGLSLGDHPAKRQTWQNACGHPVLDAFTSLGGDHGPSDALFVAQYVIPFLGLDVTGPVDPEVEQCDNTGPADESAGANGSGEAPGDTKAVGSGGALSGDASESSGVGAGGGGGPSGTPVNASAPGSGGEQSVSGGPGTVGGSAISEGAGDGPSDTGIAVSADPVAGAESNGCNSVGGTSPSEGPHSGAVIAIGLALVVEVRRRKTNREEKLARS